jgi:hypothetical protein
MSYNERLQKFWNLYREAGNDGPASTKDIAAWAHEQRLWEPRKADIIKVLAEDLSRAFREEYRTDKIGRRYRAKHPIKTTKDGMPSFLWDDMATATRVWMAPAADHWRLPSAEGRC